MQNFPNSPAPPSLPPGFSARGGGGPLYPPQPAEPQISPRMTDDYAGLQQQAQSLHRGHAHPGQASHMLAYSARNRGAVEAAPTQAGIHAGSSNNPYRKDVMDYYFSMGAKDRHRRGGMGYAAGFGYPNMDGHLPHQYRHAGSASAASSGMMSYPAEYSAGAAAGAVAGAGAFSPSQYNISQSPAMQAVPGAQMQHRQHGQTFPAVHHTPQQRSYPPHSGHRMTPQYPHYSPQSAASTGSSGMYSPPPQRYLDGATSAGFDPKVNSSPSVNSSNSVSSSAAANNVGQMESVQQGYHAANYPGYPPQTHHKQAALQHRNSQHGLSVGYDSSLKLQPSIQGPSASSAYGKHHQASASSLPQAAAQEIAKSPMHPAAQQPQINQNFSPISNPSPAASAVHSPSCSSSPSPLMGVAEAHVTPSGHAPSHPNPRSSHAQGRLLQTMPQLSPTPNSNSSISSCGSSGSHKAHSMSAAGGGGLPRSNKMGPSAGAGPREDSVYSASPLDKMQDSTLNSLSALSSQVANLPNTVQHMLLTDSVLAQKRAKDGGGQHGVPQRSRNASAASSTSTVKDGAAGVGDGVEEESSFGAKVEREEGFSEGEHGRVRQMSGASSGSEPAGYQMGQNVKTITSDSSKELKAAETKASSPVTASVIAPAQPNCVAELGLTHGDHRGGQGKSVEIKHEAIKSEGAAGKTDKGCSQEGEVKAQNGQAKDNRLHIGSRLHNEEKLTSEEQQSAGGVGVIVSTHAEKRRPQDNCVDEKPPLSYFREASSHNGDEGMDLSLYSSHRQKSNFGQTQNLPHKYSHPESTYGSDLSTRSRGRAGAESNSRYLGYQQSQAGFVQQKEASSAAAAEALVKRGSKGHEENSQLQQFPSLLQEVLQGYNLDRRYGRPEQAFPAHLQVQQYPNRHPYEAVRMQSGAGDGSTGKLPHPNQRHGNETDFPTEPQPLVKSEASSSKIMLNAEKAEAGASQSRLPQAAEAQPTPTKHINLADYSLPQRKALPGLSSSAVQELLLQEPEPLSEAHKSSTTTTVLAPSERRSVICDVSPNRRSTPERDREGEREKSQSGASVIQQPFSSPAAANDLSKKEIGEKQVVKMEAGSSKEASVESDHHGGGAANEADVEYHAKAAHSSSVINADPFRRGGGADVAHMPANPLSSPPRHQSFLHGVDLSASSSTTFPGYRYGDSREGSIIPRGAPHFPPHHPYHSLSPQTQSPNKLQMFRGPHHPHDMSDWVKAMSRTSKDVMVQPGSSPGRPKAGQSEQRQRMIPQADVPGEHAGKASLHHQSPFFDLKMWEQSGREGVRIMEGDPFYRTTQAPPPAPASHGQADPEGVSRAAEEAKHPLPPPPPPPSSTKPLPEVNSAPPKMQRQTKAGGSGDTNPLMLRRRVRSFISPIPAKRQLQERAAPNSHHSPAAQTESSHHTEDDAAGSDVPCPRLSSPLLGESSFSQPVSPAGGGAKVLPPRKGRGLKLEAIVQKITPNIKKPTGHADEESNHYPGFSHPEVPAFNDSQDQDVAHFPRAAGDDSFMDEGHALNDMLPFRGVDDAGPLSSFTCDPHQTPKQQDFDFGLGSAASGSGDKEDFALLGPLPPPPPLPRPVQGSPPPSSSALSDIQHFTNTYQQLETRRGEQSAANLLRQKLQETGIGFDDYPAGDYYGTTPPHPGHMLSRQMSSGRSSLSPQDTKPPESVVPKGYFPSGKKKGRPVGSVNKQKRTPNTTQTQAPPQNATISAPPAPLTPTPAAATPPPPVQTITTPTPAAVPPLIEPQVVPPLAPPVLTQVVKVDVESEDTQPEAEVKPTRRRRKGVKDEDDPLGARGRQRRRRRGAAAVTAAAVKESLLGDGGSLGASRVLVDPNRKGPFVPHIHVEKKVPEIGAVCTIVNAEEEKTKGGAAGGKGIESLLTSALKETEKREADEVEATLQSGKALPSSGFVVSGPVITETNHSGRLLCCLCQKWANYKHLGDLYGPFYPAEYAAKLPKNQPQVRQCLTNTASNKTGPSSDVSSNSLSSFQDSQTPDAAFKAFSESYDPMGLDSNPSSFASAFRTAALVGRDEMIHTWSTDSSAKTLSWDLNPPDIRPIPELKREPDLDVAKQPDEAQQRPQHRKLTSHPRFKRRHKSSEDSPRMVPSNSKASLPFQPPPPALDSLGPLAQLAQLPQMPMDPEELWVHEGCIVWTSGVYLVNGRLYGLQEALDGARETSCSYCDMVGSTLGCYSKGCTLRYHYLCAMEADCSLNEDNFSLRCPKHKVKKESLPRASGQPSPFTWSSQREAEGNDEEEEELQESWSCWLGH